MFSYRIPKTHLQNKQRLKFDFVIKSKPRNGLYNDLMKRLLPHMYRRYLKMANKKCFIESLANTIYFLSTQFSCFILTFSSSDLALSSVAEIQKIVFPTPILFQFMAFHPLRFSTCLITSYWSLRHYSATFTMVLMVLSWSLPYSFQLRDPVRLVLYQIHIKINAANESPSKYKVCLLIYNSLVSDASLQCTFIIYWSHTIQNYFQLLTAHGHCHRGR